MKKNDLDSLEKFEDDLSQIELVSPSKDYLHRGRNIINERRAVETSFNGRRFFSNFLPLIGTTALATAIFVSIGFSAESGVRPDIDYASAAQRTEAKNAAHNFAQSADFEETLATTKSYNGIFHPAQQFLVANCEGCHSINYLNGLIPENLEDSPDQLSSILQQNIVSLLLESDT